MAQPYEFLEFYRDITEVSGFDLETAGILKGGRKLWVLARTGQSSTLKGNDVTNAYVLLATACDGTLATAGQFTSIRVVCNRTLAVALGGSNGSSALKMPHTSFDPQAVKPRLGISVCSWNSFVCGMKERSERKVKANETMNYFSRVFSGLDKTGSKNTNERAMRKRP